MTRALLAFDAFKGTIPAREACTIVGDVFRAHGIDVDEAPIADGGDGTLDVLLAHGFTARDVDVVDAALRPRRARIGRRDTSAAIELAEVCGLVTVADLPLDGVHRSTLGLGLAARAALEDGARQVTLCVGGSASVDGGIGLLVGLGFEVLDADGIPVTADLMGMDRAARIVVPSLPPASWRVLVDVQTPMAGRESSAMVFGPQKGLDRSACSLGVRALRHWATVLEHTFGVDVRELPGGGAAGGVAAAAHAALGADIVSGAATIIDMIGLRARLVACDVVVTGEGSFDAQSLLGKGTGQVCVLAHENDRPVFLLAGRVEPDAVVASGAATAYTCVDEAGNLADSLVDPRHWLALAAARLAASLD